MRMHQCRSGSHDGASRAHAGWRPGRLAGALLLVVAFTACSSSGDVDLRALSMPWPRPAFSLTDTGGHAFDFSREAAGHTTILVFGYTQCPDVCPLNMAAIRTALAGLRPDQRSRVRVVFVTVDPEQDTPEVLRGWLDHFGNDFVGLRGDPPEVDSILGSLHLSAVMRDAEPGGGTAISHAARVLAFPPSGDRTLLYSGETLSQDLGHDLPILLSEAT